MNTIREYIAGIIWWVAYQLDKLASWIQPPLDLSEMTEEEKQQIRDLLMKDE